MAETLKRPIQVFLDTQRLIQVQPTKGFGPKRDFFKGDDAGFARHKKALTRQIVQSSASLSAQGAAAGFVLVQMREEGLAKSYRPLNGLFTPSNRFALVGGGQTGQMFFQATPDALTALASLIEQKAEATPTLGRDANTDEEVERVSVYRSELGAIEEIRVLTAADRLQFSAKAAVEWISDRNVIGGYIVELFRPDARVTPEAVRSMAERFIKRLLPMGGLIAVPFTRPSSSDPVVTLSVSLRADNAQLIELPLLRGPEGEISTQERKKLPASAPDRSVARHQNLLELLAQEPLVRRIELPMRIEASSGHGGALEDAAMIAQPAPLETYPVVGIVDRGVASNPQLDPWRAGTTGLLLPADRDEAHGSFIAGLLAGAGQLNPETSDTFEPTPSRFYDLDLLPRPDQLDAYYQTPDEFFDELETQVAKAKADAGVRVFNMSFGSPGVRQGLGYSAFAAKLDEIARLHDVIFVVAAGNLRGREARPEWPSAADRALQMLATRAIAEERITAPGEHLYGLTVGAINPSKLKGSAAGAPTTYTRRGPGPGGARKPELAHSGGAVAKPGSGTGLRSIAPDGSLSEDCGTSFATPLVAASLAAVNHRLEGQAPRETLMALAVHKASKPSMLEAKPLRAVARDFVGFGVPRHADVSLTDDPYSITLVFADVLPPRRELAFEFSWPQSLTSPNGKCRGRVDLTLCHTPPIDGAFDAECQRVQLYAGLAQLEEKVTRDGEVVTTPVQRLKPHDCHLPDDLPYTEKYLLESGLKWTPIKRYGCTMTGCGTSSVWRLTLKGLTRAGAIYPPEGVPFAILLTIADTKKAAPIYEQVRSEVLRRGLRLADITVAQRLRLRG